jgi:hypothetical protein
MSKKPASENPDLVEKQRRADANAEAQRKSDLRAVLATDAGRRYVWYLLGQTGLYRTSFATHSNQMSFNEGQRNVGLKLQAEVIEVDPSAYLKMINEEKRYG